ncbi:hypothetical protein LGR54_10130 [Ancylobacter sp. Lp-2]|uniref:hypothetical protein n=1 Tax=Ancylobacter sp. Lp-2 TaxID=2881339 RepID=UPI001E35D7EA|nr:hypothetical protein [Ancylobacter sp. Lp-2]MCB4768962.1 hypothetical protein [Ancylobacter sp. Lp-2]
MNKLSMMAVAAGLGVAAVAVPDGGAVAYEFTGAFPGGNCAVMAQTIPASKLWYGHFTGQRQWGTFQEQIQTRTVEGCFKSRGECDNWLYQWRSTYQYNFWNDYCVISNQPRPRRPYAG